MRPKWVMFNIGHIARLKVERTKIPRATSVTGCDRFSLVFGYDVILIVFFVPLGKRAVNVFLQPGSKLYEHRRIAMEMLKSGLDDYRALKSLLRVQATTKDERMYYSFMGRLGFHMESVLKKFNDGQDYLMWARIYEG